VGQAGSSSETLAASHRAIDSPGKPYYGCRKSARVPSPWAYGGDKMVDDNATAQADSAPVQFGIFDWIDRR